MADLNKPVNTDLIAEEYTPAIVDNIKALAKGLDPAVVTVTNPPTNAIRWSSASVYWEKFNGTSWAALAASYAINISGSSSKWTTGRTITFTGAATGVSSAFDGSANISIALTLATVGVAKGGTNITSYTVGDLLYASGASTLAKRAAVVTGYALISNGVGVAPSWGKIGLTTHVSGVLPVANGGTGGTTAAGARTNLGAEAAGVCVPFTDGSNTIDADIYVSSRVIGVAAASTNIPVAVSGTLTVVKESNTNNVTQHYITMETTSRMFVRNKLSGAWKEWQQLANNADLPAAASTTVAGKVELATDAETAAGTDATRAVTPAGVAAVLADAAYTKLSRMPDVATTSGTAIDVTAIPAGVNKIEVMLSGVSHGGSITILQMQIGDAGGIETAGYQSCESTAVDGGYAGSTTAMLLKTNMTSTSIINGVVTLTRRTGNEWMYTSSMMIEGSGHVGVGTGKKTLSASLDRLRLTTVAGVTFDAGSMTVTYQ